MKKSAVYYFGTENAELASQVLDGIMSKEDKTKLDGIEENANNYIHPDNHDATVITQDTTHRFVSDTEKETWNNKADNTLATISKDGLLSAEDKIKLNTVELNANNYVHPVNHPANMITQDEEHRFVSDEQINDWNAKATVITASSDNNGLMSKEDKKKLDGIAENANKYIHPLKHEPDIIIQDENNRFVTDSQIKKWDNKAETTTANAAKDGLMSRTDKQKLDAIKSYKLVDNGTLEKDGILRLSFPYTTCKFITLQDAESISNGQSSPIYKDLVNCKYLVFSIKDLDISNQAYIEKVYKFEILDEYQLKFLGGVKSKFEDSSTITEFIDNITFTMQGYNI